MQDTIAIAPKIACWLKNFQLGSSCLHIRAEKDRLRHRNQDVNRAMLAVLCEEDDGTL